MGNNIGLYEYDAIFQICVYPDNLKIFAQWYEASDICSGGNCSVTTGTELMEDDYEWYIKSWSDYGKVWSDCMSFGVE